MCGQDSPNTLRVGARADLFCSNQHQLGSLLFLDPADPGNTQATHVRFTPHEGSRLGKHMTVSIQYVATLPLETPFVPEYVPMILVL